MIPAVFLDRDGTLMEDVNYCSDPGKVRLYPGVSDALRRLRDRGFLNIIITNQSGIARGRVTLAQYEAVHAELLRQIGDGLITATYFCPDHPDAASERRKPAPGMLLEAARDHSIDLSRSWMIGDKAIDVECGQRAGTRAILVETGCGANEGGCSPDHRGKDIVAAAEFVLRNADA